MKAKITQNLLRTLKETGKGYDVNDTELPGFAVRVSSEGKPTSYSVRYRTATGRRQRLKIGSAHVLSPAQARELAQEALADVTKGNDPQDVKRALRGGQTLGSFIDNEYAAACLAFQKRGRETLRRLRYHFAEYWDWPLEDRSYASAITAWQTKRLAAGVKPATVNRDLKCLKAVFSHAVRTGCLDVHPLSSVRQLKTDTQAVIRYLDEEEERRFLSALDKREERIRQVRARAHQDHGDGGAAPELIQGSFADHLKPMVLLSLHTGLRRGELVSIEWGDVSFERSMLTLRGSVTKNGKTRHVPLNSVARSVLRDWRDQTPGAGLVFKSPRTGGRLDSVSAAWRSLMTLADIKDFRWHDMRHHFASKLVMAGVDLNTVRELLGHGDIKMTLRYAHLAPEHKAAAVERLVQT